MAANNSGQIVFPYSSFEQALKDNFEKIGGRDGAYAAMSNGYKQAYWRKGSNERRQDKQKRAMAFYDEHQKKQGGDKADRQLS